MTEQDVLAVIEYANNKLTQHQEYEDWMLFDGADVTPIGQIIPRYKTFDGKSGFNEPKLPVYQQVWKDTVVELNL